MDVEQVRREMAGNSEAIRALVAGCPREQAVWKPNATSWSILEVVNHLLDEERDDFRRRIDEALHRRGAGWFRLDPERAAIERGYNERDLGRSLDEFLAAREESIRWLAELGTADWTAMQGAPFGEIRAGDFLASWAAHDVLHMRQLVRLKWAYLVEALAPYDVRYAGEW